MTRNVCTVSWAKMCDPFDRRGLDVRPVRHIIASLLLKLK